MGLSRHIRQGGISPIGRCCRLIGIGARLLILLPLLLLLTAEELSDLLEGLVAQRIVEGRPCPTEATEALTVEDTELIDTMLDDSPVGRRGMPVEVGVEGTAERKLKRLRETEGNTGVDVCELEGVGSQIVAGAEGEVVDETDLLECLRAVGLRAHLHL